MDMKFNRMIGKVLKDMHKNLQVLRRDITENSVNYLKEEKNTLNSK